MHLITFGLVAALGALFAAGSADASVDTILVAGIDVATPAGSLAWAGENETFTALTYTADMVEPADVAVDTKLVTGLAAPEPPAIVLAGMALGSVICGRSLFKGRRKAS